MIPHDKINLMVAADPGGAEVLSAIARRQKTLPLFCLEEPALSIFEGKLGTVNNTDLSCLKRLDKSGIILTGTSLIPNLEREAIQAAKNQGLRCASYLDHWMNYEIRFGTAEDWKERLPDEIWLGDQDAYQIALQAGFPKEKLQIYPNPHFTDIQEQLKNLIPAFSRKDSKKQVLFLCEPISLVAQCLHGDPIAFGFTEETLLTDLIKQLASGSPQISKLRVRPHPKDPKEKYDSILASAETTDRFEIEKSSNTSYLEDIAWADMVVAIESIALVYAVFAGKVAISCVPSTAYTCHLPQAEIIRLHSCRELLSYL